MSKKKSVPFSARAVYDSAWERYYRKPDRSDLGRRNAEDRDRDLAAIVSLEKVVAWCGAQGLRVELSSTLASSYFHDKRVIRLSSRVHPQRMLFTLLHECGHHLIGPAHPRFSAGYNNPDKRQTRGFKHRLAVLEEEAEAWNRGWRLGLRLGAVQQSHLPGYDGVRTRMLRSYVRWADDPTGFLPTSEEA